MTPPQVDTDLAQLATIRRLVAALTNRTATDEDLAQCAALAKEIARRKTLRDKWHRPPLTEAEQYLVANRVPYHR
jgi:hypothetical protein